MQVTVMDHLPVSESVEANPLALALARLSYLMRPAVRSWSLGQDSVEQTSRLVSLVDEARSI